jgi:hypothetical protein
MIISSSDISMSSKHSRLEKYEKTEELRMWVGEDPFQIQENSQPSRDIVSITEDARNYLDKKQETSETKEFDIAPGEVGELLLVKLLVENYTGRKINLGNFTEIEDDSEELEKLSAEMEKAYAGEESQERQGWGLIYNSHESYTEKEKMMYKAKGTIRTADGREIDFKVHLKMQREFSSEESINIRAGDAALIDPLVINYAGSAADLSSAKFSFDLDSDGEDDSISFVKSGSGLLTLDLNSDGIVNNGQELFGPGTGNGFNELAAYDEDGNNWIDENDPVFSTLKIWTRDADGNDYLQVLEAVSVGAIYLASVDSEFNLKDNSNELNGQVARTGIYANENGTVGTIQQINLVA